MEASEGTPRLSIVVLAWDQLHHTRACLDSIRRVARLPYELVVVDNGSQQEAAAFASEAADRAILNSENLGFAKGMNQGLAAARGRFVAFLNNDTVLPDAWDERLVETFQGRPQAGVVVPAVTAAGNPVTVRSEPGTSVTPLPSFALPPSAVVYLMETATARALGGWNEAYELASAEDWDLCFTVWVNGLEVVYDERVLVEHVSKGTAARLDDWQALWRANRNRFLERWTSPEPGVPRLEQCPEEAFAHNLETAQVVAGWMREFFHTRDELFAARRELKTVQAEAADPRRRGDRPPERPAVVRLAGRGWRRLRQALGGSARR